MLAVVALILDFRIKKARALNKMISRRSSFSKRLERLEIILFNAFAFFIRKSKIKATTAKIQITRDKRFNSKCANGVDTSRFIANHCQCRIGGK
jgi:hypothetical protein